MGGNTMLAIVLVAFIIGGFLWLRTKKRNKK
jgi:LPXTG-motif cell wall-anchored protein